MITVAITEQLISYSQEMGGCLAAQIFMQKMILYCSSEVDIRSNILTNSVSVLHCTGRSQSWPTRCCVFNDCVTYTVSQPFLLQYRSF